MDEPETRAAIGRALLELLAEGGAISYGAAAKRAGVSKGLVQHYFPDRARLLRSTAATLAARLGARLQDAVAASTGGPAAALADVLVALLPVSADARVDEAAGRALFTLALTDPETNRSYRDGRRALAGLVRDLLAAAVADRAADPGTEWRERTARDLLGTLAELGADLVLGECSAADAEARLRERVRVAVQDGAR